MDAPPSAPQVPLLTEIELELLGDTMFRPSNEPVSIATLSRWRIEKHTQPLVSEALARLHQLGLLTAVAASSGSDGANQTDYRLPMTPDVWTTFARIYLNSLRKVHGDGWLYAANAFLTSDLTKGHLTPAYVESLVGFHKVAIRYPVDPKTGSPSERDYSLRLGGWKLPATSDGVRLSFPVGLDGSAPETLQKIGKETHFSPDIEPTVFAEVVRRHYSELEDRMLVLPIFHLVRVSPSALLTLLEEWTPADPDRVAGQTGISTVDHVVFRLVFATITDLAESRVLPEHHDVFLAAVRPEETRGQRHVPPLLELCFVGGEVLGFEAGFDTEHEYYQGEEDGPEDIYEIERNPENCWVQIWWDHTGPGWEEEGLETKLGYRFEDPRVLEQVLQEAEIPGVKNRRPLVFKQAAWLGDAIIDAYATTELLRRLTASTAHDLNQLHQKATSNVTLAAVARQLGLKVVPQWDRPTPPPPWFNKDGVEEVGMLGDSVEALVGAAYMDGGMKAAETVVAHVMRGPLEEVARITPPWVRDLRVKKGENGGDEPTVDTSTGNPSEGDSG